MVLIASIIASAVSDGDTGPVLTMGIPTNLFPAWAQQEYQNPFAALLRPILEATGIQALLDFASESMSVTFSVTRLVWRHSSVIVLGIFCLLCHQRIGKVLCKLAGCGWNKVCIALGISDDDSAAPQTPSSKQQSHPAQSINVLAEELLRQAGWPSSAGNV